MGTFSGKFEEDNVPFGQLQKSEIREMAMKAGYAELAGKSESYEICFIPENDYRAF